MKSSPRAIIVGRDSETQCFFLLYATSRNVLHQVLERYLRPLQKYYYMFPKTRLEVIEMSNNDTNNNHLHFEQMSLELSYKL